MSKFMTYDYWVDNFKPIKNKISKYATDSLIHFETYGEEVEFVTKADNKHIWTEVDGDNGMYLVSGYHIVNRINHYVTNVPWQEDEDICITIAEYVVCSCYDVNDEETEPDEDCELCYGEGTYTDWKD